MRVAWAENHFITFMRMNGLQQEVFIAKFG